MFLNVNINKSKKFSFPNWEYMKMSILHTWLCSFIKGCVLLVLMIILGVFSVALIFGTFIKYPYIFLYLKTL